MIFSASDHAFMAHALRLAHNGLTTTTPNPRVGCVIVKDNRIVGEGWHQRTGSPHAEVFALHAAADHARGATAYVTLEPCAHTGRTPPCTRLLLQAGVSRVIAAMTDPNPLVAGKGLQFLQQNGIHTDVGLLAEQAEALNIGFITRMRHGRPWVRLKAAMTLDGQTALKNGHSQWITSGPARTDGHRWRARACAILTGIGTVLQDNPQMNVRLVPCERQPLRILLDTCLRLPRSARILQNHDRPLIVCSAGAAQQAPAWLSEKADILPLPLNEQGQIALPPLLQALGKRGINELHVEAGATLNGAFLQAGHVDEMLLYIAPKFTGNKGHGLFELPTLTDLSQAWPCSIKEVRAIGSDWRLRLLMTSTEIPSQTISTPFPR